VVETVMTSQQSPPKHVLLCIDDDVFNSFTRKLVLESEGYSVLVANSGRAGLAILMSQRVDAVILDYFMPEMNGGEVAAEIRRIKPGVPILILSACLEVPASVIAIVDGCVPKGEPPTVLFSHIESVLQPTPAPVLRRSSHRIPAA
jgi:CheY-like chemotaxis protein